MSQTSHTYTNVVNEPNAGWENTKCFFFTYKSDRKHKMDTVIKLLGKVSTTFFCIREKNKSSPGYHYHAIFRAEKPPPKRWFRKGIHMNLLEIGENKLKNTIIKDRSTRIEREAISQLDEKDIEQKLTKLRLEIEIKKINLQAQSGRLYKKLQKRKQIIKVLAYMSKESPENPVQYEDYYLRIRGKGRIITILPQ
jgi:hypothetical protein